MVSAKLCHVRINRLSACALICNRRTANASEQHTGPICAESSHECLTLLCIRQVDPPCATGVLWEVTTEVGM